MLVIGCIIQVLNFLIRDTSIVCTSVGHMIKSASGTFTGQLSVLVLFTTALNCCDQIVFDTWSFV